MALRFLELGRNPLDKSLQSCLYEWFTLDYKNSYASESQAFFWFFIAFMDNCRRAADEQRPEGAAFRGTLPEHHVFR